MGKQISEMISGGYTCGTIRHETHSEPSYSLICQCTQCQKITGASHAPQIAVAHKSFKLEGQLNYFKQSADDGNTVGNGFCLICGNPILKKTPADRDRVYIHVGSLDDPGQFHPEFVIYSSSGHAWDTLDPQLKRY